jgi:hypothetical protein
MIVLNSAKAADELLVARSKIYSTRTPPHVAQDIMSASQRMVFLPYDKEFKVYCISHPLGPTSSGIYLDYQQILEVSCWSWISEAGSPHAGNGIVSASLRPDKPR